MNSVTVEEAQAKLGELIENLRDGEELVITRGTRPVARLIGSTQRETKPEFGRGRGRLILLAKDDEHLKDFAEYME